MKLLYDLGIQLYGFAISIASLFSEKAKLWKSGRKNYFEKLSKTDFSGKWLWFHTASLGEYEQAKPVIVSLKGKDPSLKILVTFFSPSGYEVRKNDSNADAVFYLPLDTKANANKFLSIVNPATAVFVRYEFWPNFLDALNTRNIPTAVMAANFRADQFMFSSLGGFILNRIRKLNAVMVQTKEAEELLLKHGFEKEKVSISGNSRIDQVIQIAEQSAENEIVSQFTKGSRTLILGSCYAEEESFTYNIIQSNPELKVIMAPHYIDSNNVERLQKALPVKSIRYSEINNQDISNFQVLVLDTMGMLSSIFKYGDFALIGGGFKGGIHSILEPASSNLPLFFGPKHKPFPEAKALIELGGAFEVNTANEFEKAFENLYNNLDIYNTCADALESYMQEQKGASDLIVNTLLEV